MLIIKSVITIAINSKCLFYQQLPNIEAVAEYEGSSHSGGKQVGWRP